MASLSVSSVIKWYHGFRSRAEPGAGSATSFCLSGGNGLVSEIHEISPRLLAECWKRTIARSGRLCLCCGWRLRTTAVGAAAH